MRKVCAPQELEEARLWELGRAVGTAVDRVHELEEAGRGVIEKRSVENDRVRGRRFGEVGHDGAGVVRDDIGLVAIETRDFAQQVGEAGAAVAGGRGEIGSAPDGSAVGRQEHGQRPAALLAGGMERGHVDLVDVGALLAVDLDVHEEVVHDRGGRRILEALVGHDVAPVTGSVSDGEQDWFVGGGGLGKRRRAPGAPMDGIVLVLEEIGTGLEMKQVSGHRDPDRARGRKGRR